MKPKFVSYDEVDSFVEKQQANNTKYEWFWDGWTVNIFTPNPRARTNKNGHFRNGNWGFMKEVKPTLKGKWVFDRKFIATHA